MKLYATLVLAVWVQTNAASPQQPEYLNMLRHAREEQLIGNFRSSEKLLIDALARLQPDDESQRADTLAELGDIYMSEEEWAQAENTYLECLSIYKRLSAENASTLMLHNLGVLYSLQG